MEQSPHFCKQTCTQLPLMYWRMDDTKIWQVPCKHAVRRKRMDDTIRWQVQCKHTVRDKWMT